SQILQSIRERSRSPGQFTIGHGSMTGMGIKVLQADPLRLAEGPSVADHVSNVEGRRDLPFEVAEDLVVGWSGGKQHGLLCLRQSASAIIRKSAPQGAAAAALDPCMLC